MKCAKCRVVRNKYAGWWGTAFTKENPCLILCPRCYKEWQNSFKG